MVLQKALCIIIGYVFGLFQTGFIIGKMHNIDIRDYGSGNSGTTNTMRTLGKKYGFITYFGDALKAVFAIILTSFMFGKVCSDSMMVIALYTGLGVVLGHNFPFYLKFKGGKGIAATAGLIISTTNIWIVLICLAAFIAIVATTRYVSLGSMTVVTIYLISVIVYGQHGGFHVENVAYLHEMYGIATFLMILAFWRHRANIKRLLSGTENKISVGGKDKK